MKWLSGLITKKLDKKMNSIIRDIYTNNEGTFISTSAFWEASEKFAKDKGVKIDNNSSNIYFKMMIDNEEVDVTFYKNRRNGTTDICVEESEKALKKAMEKIRTKS
ncbi:hypothetical protein [Sulfurovum sp.]|uniref:hypothetical protein n=1 Tax=Sulfurovum sp. TaxID=1969726 RepID=UPI00356B2DF8